MCLCLFICVCLTHSLNTYGVHVHCTYTQPYCTLSVVFQQSLLRVYDIALLVYVYYIDEHYNNKKTQFAVIGPSLQRIKNFPPVFKKRVSVRMLDKWTTVTLHRWSTVPITYLLMHGMLRLKKIEHTILPNKNVPKFELFCGCCCVDMLHSCLENIHQ